MPSIDEIRIKGEAGMAQALRALSRKHRGRLRMAIAEYGSIEAIPADFWLEMRREIEERVAVVMLLIYTGAFQSTAASAGIPEDAEQLTRQAALVAADQSVRMAADYVDGTRDYLIHKIDMDADRINRMATTTGRATIETAIKDSTGEPRIERASVTETTSAISAGQRAAGVEASADPAITVSYMWRTERDEKVCKVCGPLESTPESVWGQQFPNGPPAHPNCRCELVVDARGTEPSAQFPRRH